MAKLLCPDKFLDGLVSINPEFVPFTSHVRKFLSLFFYYFVLAGFASLNGAV